MAKQFEFSEGVMWEDNPWFINVNDTVSEDAGKPCRHCKDRKTVTNTRMDGTTYETKTWTCPYVIIVTNEGGYNSTGLCLECVLEAAKKVIGG